MLRPSTLTRPGSHWRIAIGPRRGEFGSWCWLGEDLAASLRATQRVDVFEELPEEANVVLFIKFLPPLTRLREIARRSKVVYCPVDLYGSAAQIDRDCKRLMLCDQIIVHAERLVPYFSSYASTACLEHHVKYAIPTLTAPLHAGPILWVGARSNLPPLVDYVNRFGLPDELVVLTYPEPGVNLESPEELGFSAKADLLKVSGRMPGAVAI